MDVLWTIFGTVISGVVVFVLGQIIQNYILEPIKVYNGIIGKIDNRLKYYANAIANPGLSLAGGLPINNMYDESRVVLRELSCELESSYKQIPFRSLFVRHRVIKDSKSISDAARLLIRVSNQTGVNDSNEDVEEIRKLLSISLI